MEWCPKKNSNLELIRFLQEFFILKSETVAEVMIATDRKFYADNPYLDSPRRIGYGATISAPHMHSFMLERLEKHLKPDSKVLDVGSGSGYLTACFARFINRQPDGTGFVVGVDNHPRLVELGRKNIMADDPSLIRTGKVKLFVGDGRRGYKRFAPYDVIHVGAAAESTPQELINQLKPGGRLIVPVGLDLDTQLLDQYDKKESGEIIKTQLMGVMFAPLTDYPD